MAHDLGTGDHGTALGASFSPRRARGRGLDPRVAFRRLLELGLSPLRLSTCWDEVDRAGYDELDWLLTEADCAGREVVLTVGMKAQGWPEFAIPDRLVPAVARGRDVSGDGALRQAVLELVATTVERYRRVSAVVAWQIENEPLNRSGPHRWWIAPELVGEEIAVARRTDPTRPIALNAFAAFNRPLDVAASRHGLRRLLGRDALAPEAEALGLLQPGDVLGLDVYRRIGRRRWLTRSRGWRENAATWLARATVEGKRPWVMEAQAEPWESARRRPGTPRSCRPEDVTYTVRGLRDAGYRTILLWGAEHWLAMDAAGDASWLRAVSQLQSQA